MMDALTLEAVEAAVAARLPGGRGRGADRRARRAGGAGGRGLGRGRGDLPRVRRVRAARGRDAPRSARCIWRGRKSAFAAMGRISPSYYVQDGVVPRTRLPEVLRRIYALGDEYGLRDRERLPRRRRQPAPARALRRRGRGRGRARRAAARPRSSTCASTRAARSPASTAWASTRRARCRSSSARDDLAVMQRLRDALRPGRAREPRQGASRRRASAARCRGRTARIRWSGPGLPSVSEATVEPASIAEAAEVLTGGGTRLDRPRRAATSCSRRARLDRVLEHEPGDLTAIVEAGIRLSELQAALAPHGQMLALDPPGDPDDRRVPRRRSLRPAAAPLRRDARPRDRRHASCSPTARSRARAARS